MLDDSDVNAASQKCFARTQRPQWWLRCHETTRGLVATALSDTRCRPAARIVMINVLAICPVTIVTVFIYPSLSFSNAQASILGDHEEFLMIIALEYLYLLVFVNQ